VCGYCVGVMYVGVCAWAVRRCGCVGSRIVRVLGMCECACGRTVGVVMCESVESHGMVVCVDVWVCGNDVVRYVCGGGDEYATEVCVGCTYVGGSREERTWCGMSTDESAGM